MYRIERTLAFLIDGFLVLILLFSVYVGLIKTRHFYIDILPANLVGSELGSILSTTVSLALAYNAIWIYYLATGLFFDGSIGKRLLKLKIENRKNELRVFDLVRRYAFLISVGILYTISGALIYTYRDSVDLEKALVMQNSYSGVVFFYFIICNLGRGPSIYDRMANLEIVKVKQNKESDQIASSKAAHDLSS